MLEKLILHGIGKTVTVDDRLVRIQTGVLSGQRGEVVIPFENIITVDIKSLGLTVGYIRFITAASDTSRKARTVTDLTKDPTTVQYQPTQTKIARQIEERILRYQATPHPQITQVISQTSIADELLKLKQLLDAGVLSQEEFDIQKRSLLAAGEAGFTGQLSASPAPPVPPVPVTSPAPPSAQSNRPGYSGETNDGRPAQNAGQAQNTQRPAVPAPKKKMGTVLMIIALSLLVFVGALYVTYWAGFYFSPQSNTGSAMSSSKTTFTQSMWSSSKPPKAKGKEITIVTDGDTIKTDSCEVTINSVVFSYDVLPETKGMFYTHYEADKGQVYIDIDVDVKNLAKQNLRCTDIMKVTANYNAGYTYRAMPVVEDTTGFTYANITSITPLETKAMRYLVDCPQEVEETAGPLFLVFQVDGKTYQYIVRGDAQGADRSDK